MRLYACLVLIATVAAACGSAGGPAPGDSEDRDSGSANHDDAGKGAVDATMAGDTAGEKDGPEASDGSSAIDAPPGFDAPPSVDASPPASPRQLVAGDALVLYGITSDGWAVYRDGDNTLRAAPVSGGASVVVAPVGGALVLEIHERVVFVWHLGDGGVYTLLTLWSSSTGTHDLTGDFVPALAAATHDGARVLFARRGMPGNTFGGANADGSNEVGLGPATSRGVCEAAAFVAGDRLVGIFCPPTVFGTMESWDVAWQSTQLFADIHIAFGHELAGGTVFAVTGNEGTLSSRDAAGTHPAKVFETGVLGLASSGPAPGASVFLSPDGSLLLYRKIGGGLFASPTDSPAPRPLETTVNDMAFYGISPDNAWFLSGTSSLGVTSTTAGGGRYVAPPGDVARAAPDPFTLDSAFVLALHVALYSALEVTPVAGGPTVALSSRVSQVRAGRGSKVIFTDLGGSLVAVDARTPASAITMATKVYRGSQMVSRAVDFGLTSARNAVAYVIRGEPGQNGLWFAAVP